MIHAIMTAFHNLGNLLGSNANNPKPAPAGFPVIVGTAVEEYTNGQDITGFESQAIARETGNGRVAGNGTRFRLENTSLAGGSRAEIPSKNSIVGEFEGSFALSVEGRIVTAGASFSRLWLVGGSGSEPSNGSGTNDASIDIFTQMTGDPVIQMFYRNLAGGLILLATTPSYPIAETALMQIERTASFFVLTVSSPSLGIVSANISRALVRNNGLDFFGNVTREPGLSETEEFEVNKLKGYPIS